MPKFRFKRLTRFGMRTLLLLMAVVAIWCGYYASWARWRAAALGLVAERGGFTWQRPGKGPTDNSYLGRLAYSYEETVYQLFGESLRPNMAAVEVTDAFVSDGNLALLTALSEIEWLSINGSTVDDDSLEHVAEFAQLRWLDLSGTSVSKNGLLRLGKVAMPRLEWIDVSNTKVKRDELDSIQAAFPNAKIGLAFDPAIYAAGRQNTNINVDSTENSNGQTAAAGAQSRWEAFQSAPHEKERLTAYLDAIGQSSVIEYPAWYISGVYEAQRRNGKPLLVVQTENGLRGSSQLGTLLVFDPNGALVRTLQGERVHWTLEGPTKQVEWSASNSLSRRRRAFYGGETIDLPDLDGDGFDEIPTQQWIRQFPGESGRALSGDATAIYTTASSSIPCILRIGVPNSTARGTLIDLTGMDVQLVYRDVSDRQLLLETPCYAATPRGTTLLRGLPRRTLARFVWSDEAGTFLGPAAGLNDTWVVLPPN